MARYIDTLFRYWIRFAVILVLLPVPVSVGTLIYFRTVQASTDIWVGDPTYMGSNVNSNTVSGWNQYLTPAQNETDELDQYLQTKSFLDAVGDQLATLGVNDARERDKLTNSIPKNLHVVPNGSHLLTLNFSCDHAAYCTAVLNATITVFQDRLTEALKSQEDLSTSFLQGQLTTSQKRAADSEAALEAYLNAHPGLAVSLSGQSGLPELDRLVTQAQQDRDQVIQLQNQLGQAQFTFAAADRFIQNSTKVVDPPRITAGGLLGDGSSLKRAAIVWLAAAGVAAVYLALLVWTDKTARETGELVHRLSVPVLATVPRLSAKESF
jgi:hypothetical protein